MSKIADCQKLLIAESEKKGFLTFDDIMDLSDVYTHSFTSCIENRTFDGKITSI